MAENQSGPVLLPSSAEPLRLNAEERAAMEMLSTSLALKKAEHAEKRSLLETQIAEIDREIAECNGMVLGGLKMILKLRGLEGNWSLRQDGALVNAGTTLT